MLKYEDDCVGCTASGLPCLGKCCPRRNIPVYYCDECEEEIEGEVYEVDGEDLCEHCLKNRFRK